MATDLAAATGPRESDLSPQEPMTPIPYRVERSLQETHDTVTIELVPAAGNAPPLYRPGQFNMLYVFGVGEVPISISGDSGRLDRLVHTVRDVGLVTHALAKLTKGDVIGVRGPFGNTRCETWNFTARASTRLSMSRPIATKSATDEAWSTRSTSCSMIGPSSRSLVT